MSVSLAIPSVIRSSDSLKKFTVLLPSSIVSLNRLGRNPVILDKTRRLLTCLECFIQLRFDRFHNRVIGFAQFPNEFPVRQCFPGIALLGLASLGFA